MVGMVMRRGGGSKERAEVDGLLDGSLTEIYNDRVQTLKTYAFYNQRSIERAEFPNVSGVENSAFSNCTKLETVSLPRAIGMGTYAFSSCTNLKTVKIPLLPHISDFAFYNDTNLENVEALNAGKIGTKTFWGCKALTEVDMPNVTTIGQGAFYQCFGLKEIDFPALTQVSSEAFYLCNSLVTAKLPKVEKIYNLAFAGASKLETIEAPNVRRIENSGALNSTAALKNVDFPLLEYIGTNTFASSGLEKAVFPAVKTLGKRALAYCEALKLADLGAAESIADEAFLSCDELQTLILRGETVCTLGKDALYITAIASGTGYIYVPAALVEEYKAAENWSTYADQIRAIEDYPEITGE